MWKTNLISCNDYLYISTGIVEKMWKSHLPVDNSDENIDSPHFHRSKIVVTCGNVENFIQVLMLLAVIKQFALNSCGKLS
jgi:hypothetical protein